MEEAPHHSNEGEVVVARSQLPVEHFPSLCICVVSRLSRVHYFLTHSSVLSLVADISQHTSDQDDFTPQQYEAIAKEQKKIRARIDAPSL